MSKGKKQKAKIEKIATCVGCGCTDIKGCNVDPESGYSCTWIEVDYKAKVGVCSRCVTRDNVDKYKLAVATYNIDTKSKTVKNHISSLNRREFLSSEKRREGRCE